MLANLEQIRIEGQKFRRTERTGRKGSTVKGHYRTINGIKTWIEEHTRMAHTALKHTIVGD